MVVGLFDDAIAWLVARGQTGQWGTTPFSQNPRQVDRVRGWASGGGLWIAGVNAGENAGAMVLGEAFEYVPPPERPEVYVQVLLTAAAHRGAGVGAALISHAVALARETGTAEQLRVDCWAGVPELPAQYERLGFTRTGSFDVKGWPGAVLTMPLWD